MPWKRYKLSNAIQSISCDYFWDTIWRALWHDLYPRIKWSIQLPKKVNWERREVRRPTHCTALVRFVHFCVNFTLLHLGGFTPQNMLSTGQTPQNLVGSSNLLPKSIEAFIDPSKSYSSLMCPVALEKPFAHRIFDHIFNLEWSSQRITCSKLEIPMIDLPKLSTGHTPHASLSSVREQGSVHKQEFGAGWDYVIGLCS